MFQYPEHQLFEETVYKDIAFGPKNMGFSDEEIDKRVRESAALVGLKEKHLTRSPFDLSGGQKRRVAIADKLRLAGYDLPEHIYTVKYAADAIKKLIGGGGNV